MRILKKFFAAALAVVMMASTFSMSAVEALADTEYSFEAYYGYGKSPAASTWHLTGIFDGGTAATGNGCSERGVRATAYQVASNSGNTYRYDRPNQSEISSVDIYINKGTPLHIDAHLSSKKNYIINEAVYYTAGLVPTLTSTGNTKLVQFAAASDSPTANEACRWLAIPGDVDVVYHYFGAHNVSFNTGENNATFSSAIPEYFFTYTSNTANIETAGDYSTATGISATVTPSAAPTSIVISDGTSSAIINGSDITGDVYVASDYTVSDSHAGTDVLRYNNGVYTFYNINSDISISYSYTSATATATFMADGSVYDTATVPQGTTVNAPATNPTKAGHLFKGWYAEAGCVTPFDFTAPLSADTTVYAKFVAAHEISFGTNFTEIASGDSTVTAWANATDGVIDAANLKYLTAGDYSNATGVQVSGFFDIGSGNLESVSVALDGGETVTIDGDSIVTGGIFLNTDGTLSASKGADTFAKYAYSFGNKQMFFRLYKVEQDISISATLVNTPHTITMSGHRTVASNKNWSTQTGGGTQYNTNSAGYYFTTPGNVVSEPSTASEAASSTSVGANFAIGADSVLTVGAVKVYFGTKTLTLSGEEVTGTATRYLSTSGSVESSWNTSGTTFVKYAHSASSATTYNFRFYRITDDIKIVIEYAEDSENYTVSLNDPQGGIRGFEITPLSTANTAGAVMENRVLTVTGTNLLNYNGGSVQLRIAPQDSVTAGLVLTAEDGTELARIARNGSYTSTYVNGVGRVAMSYNRNDGGSGYDRYYIRLLALHQNITISPILDIEEQGESVLGMGVEVGGTLTSYFYATVTPEVEAAEYDSYVFRAQLGSGLSQDLEALSTVEGRLVFALESIYAQCMTDKITGTFIGVKDGTETEIDSIPTGISIAEYCDRVQANNSSNTKLVTFMANMLNYGSECQKYIGYNTDNLAITGHDWAESLIGTEVPASPELGGAMSAYEGGYTGTSAKIKNAGLNVAEKIAVFFNVYAPEGISDLRITVDGYEKPLTASGTNMYRVQLLRIVPGNYDHVYVARLYSGETLLQTVRYSVNTYLDRQYTRSVSTDLMKAIYNYGLAAEEYGR
ncbi:MAG: InlB B-repeat-containing protein [Lachnospiraceae bacterium]|nr:InlB B-repeat-containing protein [Lachnospiraceae bacterium]